MIGRTGGVAKSFLSNTHSQLAIYENDTLHLLCLDYLAGTLRALRVADQRRHELIMGKLTHVDNMIDG